MTGIRCQKSEVRKKSILYLIPTLEYGGAETDLVRLATGLDRARFDATVYPFLAHGPLLQHLDGVRVLPPYLQEAPSVAGRSEMMRKSGLRAKMQEVRSVYAFCGALIDHLPAEHFDIVHAILPNAYVLGGALKWRRQRHAKLVMSRCGLNWYQREQPLYRIAERWCLHRFVCRAIANSKTAAHELIGEGVAARKVRVIHNGIDAQGWREGMLPKAEARARLGIARDAFTMTCVGNLWPYKGHEDLLAAVFLVRDRLPHGWRLLVAGRDQGGRLVRLIEAVHAMDLADNVQFLGPRDDVPVLLSAADLHVSASHTESLPNNIMEAMCAGLPVVATSAGGSSELVQHGANGLLVEPRDPRALATAIVELAGNPSRRDAMGAAGRHAIDRFSITSNIAKHIEVYEAALRGMSAGDENIGFGSGADVLRQTAG